MRNDQRTRRSAGCSPPIASPNVLEAPYSCRRGGYCAMTFPSPLTEGSFSISGVPAGTYEVEAWHPYLGTQKGSVTMETGGTAAIDFEFK